VNACRPPGEWPEPTDIAFRGAALQGTAKLARPASVTVFHNGVLVQNHFEILGRTAYDHAPDYPPHAEKLPLVLIVSRQPGPLPEYLDPGKSRDLEGKRPEGKEEKKS